MRRETHLQIDLRIDFEKEKGSLFMANETSEQWRQSLKSKEAFQDFVRKYFNNHREMKGHYDDSIYFEDYDIHLDSKDGLVVTLTTGSYTGQGMPIKDTEHVSVEDFRQLLLNKRFAKADVSLPDAFHMAADLVA